MGSNPNTNNNINLDLTPFEGEEGLSGDEVRITVTQHLRSRTLDTPRLNGAEEVEMVGEHRALNHFNPLSQRLRTTLYQSLALSILARPALF